MIATGKAADGMQDKAATHCWLFGLHIESDFALSACAAPATDVDLRIIAGRSMPVPDAPPPGELLAERRYANGQALLVSRQGGHFVLRYPGFADFALSPAGDGIEVQADPAASPEYIALLIEGSVLAFALNLRGRTVIHGAAVALDERAWAVLGPSGSGKSTLAAVLAKAGGALITDDVLALEANGDAVTCTSGASTLRLRAQAASLAPPGSALSIDMRTLFAPALAAPRAYPLQVLLLPRPDPAATEIGLRRLSPRDAFLALAANPRVLSWRRPEDLARDTAISGAVARSAAVLEAVIPWGPPFAASLGHDLIDAVQRVTGSMP